MDAQAKKKIFLVGLVFLLLFVIWGVLTVLARGTAPTGEDLASIEPGTSYGDFRARFDARPDKELEGIALDDRIDLYDYYFSDRYERTGEGSRYLFYVTPEGGILGFGFDADGLLERRDLYRTDLTVADTERVTVGMPREEAVALLGAPHTHLDGYEGYKATGDGRWFALRYEGGAVADVSWELQK